MDYHCEGVNNYLHNDIFYNLREEKMKRKLGISIYPEKSTVEKDKEYIEKAHKYGFSKIFTCLLSVDKPIDIIKKEFTEIIDFADGLGMEVILDISPAVFDKLNISYNDLSFFKELGAAGIRLDLGFDGLKEAQLTYDKTDLKIELNMSNDIDYLNNILSYTPNKDNLIGSHNFYPQKYTGLEYEYFLRCSRRFKEKGIRTSAFISSQTASFGPWSINDGLCTLEMHRGLPAAVQAKHLWATGLIDDVVIGNAYAAEEELKALGELNPYLLELDVELEDGITDIEKKILFQENHLRRGDISEYMIRSTEVRKRYTGADIPARNYDSQKIGDIVIGNNEFGKYKGETQIVIKDMPADSRKNRAGKVTEEELFLLSFIGPWINFKFKEKK